MMLAISRNKDPKASAPYLSLLKLPHSPFSDHAGEAFFYADPERAQYLDMLQHLAQYSDEVLLVSGEAGSGKTELLERFLERAEEHWRTCRLDAGERLEADRLFSRIAECFGLELAGGNLLEVMQAQLGAMQEQQLPVLLIDNAHALSDDALEIVMHLAVLEGEHGKLVRVLMFANPSMDQRLASERFAAMPQPHRQELHGLDEEHVAAYIEHRLHAAGYRGAPLFTGRDVKQLLRETAGLPGALNDAAHEMLLHKLVQDKPKAGMRRYLQMGLAASAVIGTVLGLNDKINALLGGVEPKAMSISAPERPVIRLADAGNPWAVVIRDGESIQVNCGAPGGTTVGVRPLMTAAVDMGSEMPMSQPIMKDVTPADSKQAMPVQEHKQKAIVAPEKDTEATAGQKDAEPEVKTEKHEEKGSTALPSPTQVASNDVSEPQLVVKPHEDKAPAEKKEKENKTPLEVKLESVQPAPVPTAKQPTKVTLRGSGFQPDSKVAVSHAGRVLVLQQTQVSFVDSEQMDITITPGEQASDWAVQVSTPDNRRSNVLRFRVEPQASVAKVAEAETTSPVVAPKPEAKPIAEKPVEEVPATAASKEKKAEEPVVKTKSEKADAVKKAAVSSVPQAGKVQGYDWYASQPKSNFTLQLLVSEKRQNVESYARKNKLKAPIGEFVMERKGKQLYAVTQGSYPNRAAAEKAVASLPAGTKPWIRSIESIQQIMKHEQPAAKPQAAAPVAGGERYKDTAWVWSQNPNHFTIQLSAASSEQAIETEMRRTSLPGELTVVQTLRDGKPWYALVYGSFASKEAARGTIERLPAVLKQAGPWPRSFSSLQDEISRSTPAQ